MTDSSDGHNAGESSRPPKDWWDKADIVIKGIGALLVGGVITWYGIYSQQKETTIATLNRNQQFQIAEKNRKAQLIIQTMGNRENADSDMRAKMFDTLMTHYFGADASKSTSFRSRLRILELIALNFQDAFNPKPLFEELNAETSDKEEKQDLRKVARMVIKKQTEALVGGGGQTCSVKLIRGGSPAPIDCIPILQLQLLSVDKDGVQLSVGTDMGQSDENLATFHVNYFDMPSVDNTRLNELIYAITLPRPTDPDNKSAIVQAILFPKHYYGGREQLLYDDLVGDMLDSIQTYSAPSPEQTSNGQGNS